MPSITLSQKCTRRKCHCPNWCSSVSRHRGSVFCRQSCRVRRTARARDDTQARIIFCFEMFYQQFYPEMSRATTGCYPFAIGERWPKTQSLQLRCFFWKINNYGTKVQKTSTVEILGSFGGGASIRFCLWENWEDELRRMFHVDIWS